MPNRGVPSPSMPKRMQDAIPGKLNRVSIRAALVFERERVEEAKEGR